MNNLHARQQVALLCMQDSQTSCIHVACAGIDMITAHGDKVAVLCRTGWLQGLQLLLAASPALDVPNKRGLSALGEAVAGGNLAAAEMLIKSGADVCWRASG